MKISLLVFAALSVLTYCCPPPFNDIRYSVNTTLLHEAINEHNAYGQLSKRWSHVVGSSSPLKIWPSGSDKLTVIPFCYVDQFTKNKIGTIVTKAWDMWYKKIGNPSSEHGHRLKGLVELKDGSGASEFCYTDFRRTTWNAKVPGATLAVDVKLEQYNSQATQGYKSSDWANHNGRHFMRIGWFNSPDYERHVAIHIAAHEMGHVFGLAHEHQRTDRDHYIRFQCENLANYKKALALLPKHPDITMETLCTSPLAALESPWKDIAFAPAGYSTIPYWEKNHKDSNGNPDGEQHPYNLVQSKDYDVTSIMHYSSMIGAEKDPNNDISGAVLVKWLKGAPDFTPPAKMNDFNADVIEENTVRGPSQGDFEAIKLLYPWNG